MKQLALIGFLAMATPLTAWAQVQIWESDIVGASSDGHLFRETVAGDNGSFWMSELIWNQTTTFRIQRRDADGNLLVSTSPLDPNGIHYDLRGISPDGAGGLHFVGTTFGPGLFRHLGNGRIDASGQVLWFSPLLSLAGENAFDTTSDGAGGNYVVGETTSGASSGMPVQGDKDALVARFDSSGQLMWGWSYGVAGATLYLVEADQDGAGGVIALGVRTVGSVRTRVAVRLSSTGAKLWSVDLPGAPFPYDMAADDAGGAAFVGADSGAGWVGHVDSMGALDWATPLPQMSYTSTVLHQPNGEWLVCGTDGGSSTVDHVVLVRLSASGAVLSTVNLDEISSPLPEIEDLLMDSEGNLILGGSRWSPVSFSENRGWIGRIVIHELSTPRCPGTPNSTGSPAIPAAHGSPMLGDNRVTLFATGLPAQAPAIFVTSRTVGSVPNPGGADGVLCLGGPIGRYARPGEVLQADGFGRIHLGIDMTDLPIRNGGVSAMAGEEWHYQAWYRDVATFAGSNFSSSASIVLQ